MSLLQAKQVVRNAVSIEPRCDRHIIVNGDDFGLSAAVNDGIILGYREGILRSASLMVGEAATDEAVELARRHPGLAVGLHVALSDARPVLPPEQISHLVGTDGRFYPDESIIGKRLLVSAATRRQLRAEIAAQFAAFRKTGLECDHVNTHRNVHLHPVIATTVFREAAHAQISAIRIPWQPPMGNLVWHHRRSAPLDVMRYLRVVALRNMARLYGLRAPDWSVDASGRAADLCELLTMAPVGVTEVYLHPATADEFPGNFPGFRYLADLASLRDPAIKRAAAGLPAGGYGVALRCAGQVKPVPPAAMLLRRQ